MSFLFVCLFILAFVHGVGGWLLAVGSPSGLIFSSY